MDKKAPTISPALAENKTRSFHICVKKRERKKPTSARVD
jgi:hypothetical protein